ncbi:MAG TPA: zinc ribbon domain-containing protein [Terriglobales bacterium]|nr:zinc ribbon domain-containing protein [Terriglobales bacterium]
MQCPQCRQTVVEGSRFCSQCGSAVTPSTCTSCAASLPAHARFCPGCGTAVTSLAARHPDPPVTSTPPPATPAPPVPPPSVVSPSPVVPPSRVTRAPTDTSSRFSASDPAEALLAARDPDGTLDDEPSPDDLEVLRRVQEDRARTRSRRRSIAIMVAALLVLVAAVAYSRRSSDERIAAPPADATVAGASESSTPSPRPANGRPAESGANVDTARPVMREPARPQPDRTAAPAPSSPRPSRLEAQRAERIERAERERAERAERARVERAERDRERAERPERVRSERVATRDRVPDPARNTVRPADTRPTDTRAAETRPAEPARPMETARATEAPRADAAAPGDRSVELPPRAEANAGTTAQAPTAATQAPTPAPTATPSPRPATPNVRVEVAQKRDGANGAIDYTVRLSNPTGEPVTGADVRLRGVTADGLVVEAPLEPAGAPGVYHGLVAFSDRGPRGLTLRIARADGVLEVPVSAGAGAGSSNPR